MVTASLLNPQKTNLLSKLIILLNFSLFDKLNSRKYKKILYTLIIRLKEIMKSGQN